MKKIALLVSITLVGIINCSLLYPQGGQRLIELDDYTKVVPPSPTAYELGKYGQVPVGYFTGTPNISVPLYTYQAGRISIPISLSYNSNGIKVDQLASNVGLGWSLDAGGVITRIVKDLPDESSYEHLPFSRISRPLGIMDYKYFLQGSDVTMDSEADVYMYNFMGYSGKFMYDRDKKVMLMPVKDLLIDQYMIVGTDDFGFRITTADGMIYEFEAIEKTLSFSNTRDMNHPLITAWYLSRIIHPLGNEVAFYYNSGTYEYINSTAQYYYKSDVNPPCSDENGCKNYDEVKTLDNHSIISFKRLSSLSSNNPINGSVEFYYDLDHPEVYNYKLITKISVNNAENVIVENLMFDYLSTYNKRVFLSNIKYKDTTKQYHFEYVNPEALCERLSYSQDYWGYYNNESNSSLLPQITDHSLFIDWTGYGHREPRNIFAQKGLLKKITYPTGGSTNFNYEANTYFGDEVVYPDITTINLETICETRPCYGVWDTTGLISFDNRAIIEASAMLAPGCDSIHSPGADVEIIDISTGEISPILIKNGSGWINGGNPYTILSKNVDLRFDLKEGHSYKVIITPSAFCQKATFNMDYYYQDYTVVQKDIETGGSRIKQTINYEPITGIYDTTAYYYNEYENILKSSGEPGSKGYYISERTNRMQCGFPCSFIDCKFWILQSNSLTSLFNIGSNNIYYEFVTVSKGGSDFQNGGETHEYIIQRDYAGFPLLGDGFAQSSSTWTNFGWNNGLEKSVKTFKVENNSTIPVSIVTNNYTNDERMADTIYSYAITKDYDNICSPDNNFYHICTDEETQRYSLGWRCNLSHTHHWYCGSTGTYCIADPQPFWNHNVRDTLFHPCYNREEGETIIYHDQLDNLNVIEYMSLSSWNYMSSSTLEEYSSDNTGKVSKTTEYFYDNPNHLQLSRVESEDSKSNMLKTQMYFPQDYDTSIFSNLIHKHIISSPIDQRTLYNNKLQNGRLVKYNELSQPVEIYEAETEKGTELAFNQNNPYSYANDVKKKILEYDPTSHNLVSYKNEGDMETVILWGYNYSKPIAKIENATTVAVVQVLTEIGESYESLQTLSGDDLIDKINQLRESPSLANSMVTSYTYNPMIGMTSVTDPNGIITKYDYDDFGRLQTISDTLDNILKHFDYHYAEIEIK
ncbi:MAG: RHS repeat domain-containing protein [Bacteroidales bacterium]|nr:RHS repeat domain-containing protein [Bacteroidales bacterium]